MNDSTRGKCLNAPGTLQRQGKNACMEEKLLNISLLCMNMYRVAGRHNLRSFLAANSTQNYFLIARMLSFL